MALTKAKVMTQVSNIVKAADQLYQYAEINSPNFQAIKDTLYQNFEGDHVAQVTPAFSQFEKTLNDAYVSMMKATEAPLKVFANEFFEIPVNGRSMKDIMKDIAYEMSQASETVRHRDITRGSVSVGGSNVGGATTMRTTTDENGDALETGQVGKIQIKVVKDKSQGALAGNETLEISGAGKGFKNWANRGDTTNLRQQFNITSAYSNSNVLRDPGFDSFNINNNGSAASGWTMDNTANFTIINKDTSSSDRKIYRFSRGQEAQATPAGFSIQFDATSSIAQYVGRTQAQFNNNAPYALVVPWMRRASCTGTLRATLGGQSNTATIGSATNDVWNLLTVGVGSNKGWYRNFKEDWSNTGITPNRGEGVQVKIATESQATGTVVIGHLVLAQMLEFNGAYYLVFPGDSDSDVVFDDIWTYTDSENATGRNQFNLAQFWGVSLPHTNTSETYADA